MNHDHYDDDWLRGILAEVRTIAVVGASTDWNRASGFVMKYLIGKGYRTIPVNPKFAGQDIFGERCLARMAEAPVPIDMVDVFRNSAAVPGLVEEALALSPLPKVIWMQFGVRHDAAAAQAEAAGIKVVMNRCPKVEWARLHGELSWSGFNTGILSSKKRKTNP